MRSVPATFLLAALLLASAPARGAGAASWYLNEGNEASNVQGAASHVFVAEGETLVWAADEAALAVDYADASWPFSVVLSHAWIGTFRVAVGTLDADGFAPKGASPVLDLLACRTALDLTVACEGDITMYEPLSVAPGERLAFAIVNVPDAGIDLAKTLDVLTGTAGTRVDAPASTPAMPTPELSTMLLSGAGLAVVALVVAKRR